MPISEHVTDTGIGSSSWSGPASIQIYAGPGIAKGHRFQVSIFYMLRKVCFISLYSNWFKLRCHNRFVKKKLHIL